MARKFWENASRPIEGKLERITEAYVNGWWSKDRYLENENALKGCEMRCEMSGTLKRLSRSRLGAWQTGDSHTRQMLLTVFFEELDVEGRTIAAVVPRKDRAAEVIALLDKAYDQYCRSDPGGIRPAHYPKPELRLPADLKP